MPCADLYKGFSVKSSNVSKNGKRREIATEKWFKNLKCF